MQKWRYYNKTANYPRKSFTQKEEELILAHEMTDTELSELIERSVMAIQVKRSRLKKQLGGGG